MHGRRQHRPCVRSGDNRARRCRRPSVCRPPVEDRDGRIPPDADGRPPSSPADRALAVTLSTMATTSTVADNARESDAHRASAALLRWFRHRRAAFWTAMTSSRLAAREQDRPCRAPVQAVGVRSHARKRARLPTLNTRRRSFIPMRFPTRAIVSRPGRIGRRATSHVDVGTARRCDVPSPFVIRLSRRTPSESLCAHWGSGSRRYRWVCRAYRLLADSGAVDADEQQCSASGFLQPPGSADDWADGRPGFGEPESEIVSGNVSLSSSTRPLR